MGFKRAFTDVIVRQPEGTYLRELEGWMDEKKEYFYCKLPENQKIWEVIDVEACVYVYTAATRKECVAWVQNNYEEIRNHPNRFKYKELAEKLRRGDPAILTEGETKSEVLSC